MEPYVENATALASYDEEIERNFRFFGGGGGLQKWTSTTVCLWYARLSQEKYRLEFCFSWWNCMLQPYIESATALSDVCMCPCFIRTNILLLSGTSRTRVSLSNSYQNTWQLCSHSCLCVHLLHMFCVKRDKVLYEMLCMKIKFTHFHFISWRGMLLK